MKTNYIETQLPDLKSGEVYISHIGDGEYEFNVFGNVYDNLLLMWDAIEKAVDINRNELTIAHHNNWNPDVDINTTPFFIRTKYGQNLICITIEKINSNIFRLWC